MTSRVNTSHSKLVIKKFCITGKNKHSTKLRLSPWSCLSCASQVKNSLSCISKIDFLFLFHLFFWGWGRGWVSLYRYPAPVYYQFHCWCTYSGPSTLGFTFWCSTCTVILTLDNTLTVGNNPNFRRNNKLLKCRIDCSGKIFCPQPTHSQSTCLEDSFLKLWRISFLEYKSNWEV